MAKDYQVFTSEGSQKFAKGVVDVEFRSTHPITSAQLGSQWVFMYTVSPPVNYDDVEFSSPSIKIDSFIQIS